MDDYTKVDRYFVSEYGTLKNNIDDIKAEIYARGPIACSMYSTYRFEDYESGIYR